MTLWMRRAGATVLGAATVVTVVFLWWHAYPPNAIDALRAYRSPLASVVRTPVPEFGPRVERWTMVDERGETFTALWRAAHPREDGEAAESGVVSARPWTVVLLGGFYAGDRAALLVPDTVRVHMLAVDWPWNGPRKLSAMEFVRLLPAIRRTVLSSPAALALGVDAVSRQPEVDPGRIALVGASLGVPPTAAALELTDTPAASVLVYGGADIERWMSHALVRHVSPDALAPVVASLASEFVRPLEPAMHSEAATKVRMLILNARADQLVPIGVAEALHRAFPWAVVRWKEGRHISDSRSAVLDGLAAEVETWLEAAPPSTGGVP